MCADNSTPPSKYTCQIWVAKSPTLLAGHGLDAEIAHLTSFLLAADFARYFPFQVWTEVGFISTPDCFQKWWIAAWFLCSEAYSPIDASCSGMNLAYFPLGLLLPCDIFLTALLAPLIAAGLMCADRVGQLELLKELGMTTSQNSSVNDLESSNLPSHSGLFRQLHCIHCTYMW